MAKPLKVDEMWLERIASLLNDMEFGSSQIVVHEGQIVQMERTGASVSRIRPPERSRRPGHPANNEERAQDDPARLSSIEIRTSIDDMKCTLSSRLWKNTLGC